jgi:hypothetical protein
MSTRSSTSSSSSRGSSARDTESTAAPLNMLADLPRRQLALMTQSASAMFRGSEAMRKIQQQAAQRATEHTEEVAQRLRGQCDFNDLLAIQADLVRFNMQEAAQYWQQLAMAGMKLQADMVSRAGQVALDGAGEPTLDSLQRAFEATLNGAGASSAAH